MRRQKKKWLIGQSKPQGTAGGNGHSWYENTRFNILALMVPNLGLQRVGKSTMSGRSSVCECHFDPPVVVQIQLPWKHTSPSNA